MGVPRKHLGKWRSIEFECILKNVTALNEFVEFLRVNKHSDAVTIKMDASIHADNYYNECPREIVVSYRSGKEQIVHDICAFLKNRAYVNSSCGTHVHFDMRHVNPDMARLYGARLACAVPALKKILPRSRRNNEYCEGTINHIDSNPSYDGDRYCFVNLQAYYKHKTIEVRAHSGTLNANKILNWIALCELVMFSDTTKSVKTIKDLIKHYKPSKPLESFVVKRHREVNARSAAAET